MDIINSVNERTVEVFENYQLAICLPINGYKLFTYIINNNIIFSFE